MKIRLQKFMAEAGIASRRQSEQLIVEGRVVLNGKVVDRMGVLVDPYSDHVIVDGYKVKQPKAVKALSYFVLNKPRQVVTTMKDPEGRRAIADFVPRQFKDKRLFPVGRLDYDVAGCILLMDDGELANKLTHPKFGIDRVYRVKVKGKPSANNIEKLKRRAKRCRVKYLRSAEGATWWILTLYEGKYHQVKKLWMEIGHPVEKMSRESFAGVSVRGLKSGALRPLLKGEVKDLKQRCRKPQKSNVRH